MKKSTEIIFDGLMLNYPKLAGCRKDIVKVFEMMVSAALCGGTVFTAGNGGSAADALHISAELSKSFLIKREDENGLQSGIRSISLVGETALITAIINDMGAEFVFSQQLNVLAKKGDMFLALTTSGMAKNIVEGVILAKKKGIACAALTGMRAGELGDKCDARISVPETETYRVQEYHISVYHALCAAVENEIFGD